MTKGRSEGWIDGKMRGRNKGRIMREFKKE